MPVPDGPMGVRTVRWSMGIYDADSLSAPSGAGDHWRVTRVPTGKQVRVVCAIATVAERKHGRDVLR
jgi:hypothetical protein